MLLYRLDVPRRFPQAWQAIGRLEGRIDERQMIAMNARAELDGRAFDAIAGDFLAATRAGRQCRRRCAPAGGAGTPADAPRGLLDKLFGDDLARITLQHVMLVVASVVAAAACGVPLGVVAARLPRLRGLVLSAAGLLQTVPSLAMLALLISATGLIGTWPTLIALTLYALLPIARNTCTGLLEVPPGLVQAGSALGLHRGQVLRAIELPLALPVILAGVRTATVINVGTATIAAFIGAGGFGERIVTGLALNDRELLLAGAIPAAALAVVAELGFELLERRIQAPTPVVARALTRPPVVAVTARSGASAAGHALAPRGCRSPADRLACLSDAAATSIRGIDIERLHHLAADRLHHLRRRLRRRACSLPCSQQSARSACSTSSSGTVPNSSAMPVYSACGHSSSAAVHIGPVRKVDVEVSSFTDVTAGPHQARARRSGSPGSQLRIRSPTPVGPRPVCTSIQASRRAWPAVSRSTRRRVRLLQLGSLPPKKRPSANSCWPRATTACSALTPVDCISSISAASLSGGGATARAAAMDAPFDSCRCAAAAWRSRGSCGSGRRSRASSGAGARSRRDSAHG